MLNFARSPSKFHTCKAVPLRFISQHEREYAIIPMMLRALIKSMRPRQWTKNGVIFAALVFDGQLFSIPAFLRTFVGFIIFCLLSGVVYIINDLADIEADRKHPVKRNRPLAAGKLSKQGSYHRSYCLAASADTNFVLPLYRIRLDRRRLFAVEPGVFKMA